MTLISRNALVPYSVEEMFALVDDIESYAEFLPWCRSTDVLSRDDNEVQASIEIARGALNKSFTTLNRLQKDKIIEMRLLKGPFKHLQGYWRFDALKDKSASKISLDLEFEFESKLIAFAVGPVFNQIGNSMVDAFCKRAVEVYGERI
ncbi:MAG: ubiquinone-binding protein [endosymbiont of Galathealinum brachiosum]|uniref:Ubiquinone-binding protein n=1 Tax=endosymbiont of Galathealinum brachiosum TaxID=2200906 RepID=A0A370D826_9GAMM|nr:MAG: ubiquinone-binding protein [endosymbiont of Galathealinum brachiosum]